MWCTIANLQLYWQILSYTGKSSFIPTNLQLYWQIFSYTDKSSVILTNLQLYWQISSYCYKSSVILTNLLSRTSASKDLFREEPQIGLLLMGGIAVFSYFIRAVTQETSVPEQVKRFQREEMDHAENYLKSANGRRCKRPSKEEAILNWRNFKNLQWLLVNRFNLKLFGHYLVPF